MLASQILEFLRQNNYLHSMLLLHKNKTNINDLRLSNGMMLLHYVCICEPDLIHPLLMLGADPNALDDHGMPTLAYALSKDNIEIIQLLVQQGANLNFVDSKGRTLFMLACICCNKDIILYLMENMNESYICLTDNKGRSAIDYAKEFKRTDIIHILENIFMDKNNMP